MVAISEAMATAMHAYRAGNLVQAEWLCHQVLEQQPNVVSALHLLGAIATQTGRLVSAVQHYQRVIALDPTHFEAHSNLAVVLQEQGDFAGAANHFHRSLALNPYHAPTHFNAGNLALKQGQIESAIAHYQQAIALKPDYAKAHANLGNALRANGDLDGAIAHYRQAIALEPNNAQTHSNLGNVLQEQAQRFVDAAFEHYQTSLKLQPHNPDVYFNLGNAMRDLNQWPLAANNYRQALLLRPNWAAAHNNLALSLQALDQRDAAVVHLQQAIAIAPEVAEAHNNLGNLLYEQNALESAITHFERAIAIDPDYARAHFNLGVALLAAGDFNRGFAEYEWRWRCPELNPPSLPGKLWHGEAITQQTILLGTEQGMGDSIQFIRYAPLVAERAGRVIVTCPASLIRLFATVSGIDALIPDDEPLPKFDVYCPLMSLPRAFQTTVETIPRQTPYLKPPIAPPALAASPLNVGLVWASEALKSPKLLKSYHNRTAPLPVFGKLRSVPGVTFYSLQVGLHAADIVQCGFQDWLHDLSAHLQDFADTAAAIAQLDLVITVDTAVAHLAGALAKPVWVVLPLSGDWRWLVDREDSPWYPTMRLFRQTTPGDWEGVLANVVQALQVMRDRKDPS